MLNLGKVTARRIVLVEPDNKKREAFAERLRIQGFKVDALGCAHKAAIHALGEPPDVVVADLWMPGISGVQLCRLLRSEAATEGVPVILRGLEDTPRERFWADRAGASAYVAKGRMGELVRALRRSISLAPEHDGFFQIYPETLDIRERIGKLLDKALFSSVLASEIRALSTCSTFTQMFDLFSQFLCQVTSYRWLAILTPNHAAVHIHPGQSEQALGEVRTVLKITNEMKIAKLEDEDAENSDSGQAAIVRPLLFGDTIVGRVALAPVGDDAEVDELMALVACELGGPIRIVSLVEETQRLASHDPLTGIFNRRAFTEAVTRELSRADRLNSPNSLLLFDIDHFKHINDRYGHLGGDKVLTAVGQLLHSAVRVYDLVARWGGEEFVVALPQTSLLDALTVAERIRIGIEALQVVDDHEQIIQVTVSIGVVKQRHEECLEQLIERADIAMYSAKAKGRNCVVDGDEDDESITDLHDVKPPAAISRTMPTH